MKKLKMNRDFFMESSYKKSGYFFCKKRIRLYFFFDLVYDNENDRGFNNGRKLCWS